MTIETVAQIIRDSHAKNTRLQLIKDTYPDFSIADAYAVQLANVNIRIANGETVTGKKVGLTNDAMQQAFQVTEPDFGVLFATMEVTDGTAPAGTLQAGRVEGEIAFKLAQDLPQSNVTVEAVLAATEWVSGAFEIVDSRVGSWTFNIVDTIADNGSSVGYQLGTIRKTVEEIDITNETVELYKNGELAGQGVSSAALGNPAASVAWLANALGRQGQQLRAGEVVLTGAISGAIDAAAGDTFQLRYANLGTIDLQLV